MEFLKHLIIFSMLATAGIPATDTYIPQVIEAEPLQAEVITEAEVPEEESVEKEQKTVEKAPKPEEAAPDEHIIDDEEIGLCDHIYTRVRGTGGEEGEVWEYTCDLCGDTYFEPYDGPDDITDEIEEELDDTEPAGEDVTDETEES